MDAKKLFLKDLFCIDITGRERYIDSGSTYKEIAIENLMDGNYNSARYHINNFIYDSLVPQGIVQEGFVGLRFYNIDNHLDDILEQTRKKQLCLGRINFNDALDPLLAIYIQRMKKYANTDVQKKWYRLLQDAMGLFRIACLCQATIDGVDSILNQLMWAHYANSHTGIAIKYRIKKENQYIDVEKSSFCYLSPVQYEDVKLSLKNLRLSDAMNFKSKVWEYEQEQRMIFYSGNEVESFYPIENVEMEAVYLGVKINRENESKIRKEMADAGIQVFKMKYDNKDLLSIKPQ